MTISDSIPIQFWLNGRETFNENAICGLSKQECFCQPFQCDDTINLQIQDTENRNYVLTFLDPEGAEITQLPFISTLSDGVYVYSLEFTFAGAGICDEDVQLKISYVGFAYSISGGVTAPLGLVDGDIDYVGPGGEFFITGSVTAPIGLVDGDAIAQSRFRFDTVEEDICLDQVPYGLAYHVQPFGAGTILYSDAALTTPYAASGTPTFIRMVGETVYYDYDDATATVGAIQYEC